MNYGNTERQDSFSPDEMYYAGQAVRAERAQKSFSVKVTFVAVGQDGD